MQNIGTVCQDVIFLGYMDVLYVALDRGGAGISKVVRPPQIKDHSCMWKGGGGGGVNR